ncbi:hypothetical protein BH20BAC1_BH20BAC1_24870 [soil metagenome]
MHQFNRHDRLNDFIQKLAVKTNTIHASANNILDFDNVILENEKQDAAKTYKMTTGYQPAIASIGRQLVFIEGIFLLRILDTALSIIV